MKDVRLKELTLSNWKGQTRKVSFGDNENMISGANASGKTSLMRAWQWVLTGYCDPNSPMNAYLFNNKEEVTKDTPIASVKAVVSIDGEIYTIERSAEAKFQRKGGTESWEKASSDSYVYKVDEIKRSANDFRDWLSEKFTDIDMLKFAVDGSYFVSSIFEDKKKSRQIIKRLVGSVKREEMQGDYADIDELLKKYTLDEIEAQATNLAKGISQRLNEIPTIVSNMEKEVAEIEQTDFNAVESKIKQAETERDALDRQTLDLSERMKPQMEAKYKAQSEKRMKQEVYDKALSEFKRSNDSEIEILKGEIAAVQRQNKDSQIKYNMAVEERNFWTRERDNAINNLKIAETKRERLLKERDEEKAKTLDHESTKCPHCGAELTGEKLQQVIDRFERVKRERIDAIVAEGKATAEEIKRLEQVAIDAQPKIDAPLPEVINQSTADLESRVTELAGHVPTKEDFDNTEYGKELLAAIESVVIPEVAMPDDSEIKAKKDEVNAFLVPLYEKRGLKSRAERLKKQICDLQKEQREKGSELALYERRVKLVKDYKQEQMEILSHKVNDGLKSSRIECWSKQKDGTVVADLLIKDASGVNFACTNNASRIVTTCDIQRFFCDKLHVNMPCWIDECSVVDNENLPRIDNTQMFYIFRADTELNIESK